MKTDFGAIREELQKLTDVEYLKKELSRAAKEIRNFDIDKMNVSPEAKAKLHKLEQRFKEAVKKLRILEKQVDAEVNKYIVILKKFRGKAVAKTSKKKATKKTARKAAKKR